MHRLKWRLMFKKPSQGVAIVVQEAIVGAPDWNVNRIASPRDLDESA